VTHRRFVDADEGRWTVWEVHYRASVHGVRVWPELAGGWLAFQCRAERRRLWPVPDAWETLSAAELERLCRLADVAPHGQSSGRATTG